MDRLLRASHAKLQKYMSENVGPGTREISSLSPHVYVGTHEHAIDTDLLKDASIGAVLTLLETDLSKKTLDLYQKRDIAHKYVYMTDDPKDDVRAVFSDVYDFIHHNILEGRKILIHCRMGVSRSIAMVMYYYLTRFYATNYHRNAAATRKLLDPNELNLLAIANFVKSRRPCAEPNPGYLYQLVLMEFSMKQYYSQEFIREAESIKVQLMEDEVDDMELSDIFESERLSLDQALRLVFREAEPATVEKPEENYDRLEEIPNLLGTV